MMVPEFRVLCVEAGVETRVCPLCGDRVLIRVTDRKAPSLMVSHIRRCHMSIIRR